MRWALAVFALAVFAAAGEEPGRVATVAAIGRRGAGVEAVTIDELVNIGKAVWDLIKENRPVVDYTTDWATATPKGADWWDLEGFVDRREGPYGWAFRDVYGVTLVEFAWDFSYACKGSYDGHGAFLDAVGAAVRRISAAWGWSVNVNVTIPGRPTNYGTKVDPIAGLGVDVALQASSVLQNFVRKCRTIVRGDCTFSIVACDGY